MFNLLIIINLKDKINRQLNLIRRVVFYAENFDIKVDAISLMKLYKTVIMYF